jgi:Mn2+/Fe2+ NRAMP family transporter
VGKVRGLALGVLTALGGFVDMGELVTCSQAGAQFKFSLLWTVAVGVLGIMVFTEMTGRVAIASGRGLYDVIRERLGFRLGLASLAMATLVNVLTIVIEICGMALVFEIILHVAYLWFVPVMAALVIVVLWYASFTFVENSASMLGLTILVFVVAAVALKPDWGSVGSQLFLPSIPPGSNLALYGFSAVGLLGAFMTPYEVFFYSSGAIEEKWTGKDFVTNRTTTILGYTLGSTIVISMMVVAATVYFPHGVQPQAFENVPVPIELVLGTVGLVLFACGAFATTAGAAFEATLSTAYTVCQFFGWDWGQDHEPKDAPLFSASFLVAILGALLVVFTGINPVKLTIYTTALAGFCLPLTFIPLLLVANDKRYMGEQTNGRLANVAAIFFLVILCTVTVATLPLFILSGFGGG